MLQIDDATVRGAQQTTFGCETVVVDEKIRHTTERFNLRVGKSVCTGNQAIWGCMFRLYNRCVLEAQWPAHAGSSQVLWNKLRNVVIGAAHFKFAGRRRVQKNCLSASTEFGKFATVQSTGYSIR